MFNTRTALLALSLAVVGYISASTPVANGAHIRPYSPELYERSVLLQDEQKRSVANEAARPYSPELYFRDALLSEEEEEEEKREEHVADKPTMVKRATPVRRSTPTYSHVFGRRTVDQASQTFEEQDKRWFWPSPSGSASNPISLDHIKDAVDSAIEAKKEAIDSIWNKWSPRDDN